MPNKRRERIMITFPPQTIEVPVTWRLVKDFDLRVNIQMARVTPKEEGLLVLDVEGERENFDRAIEYLEGLKTRVDIVPKGVDWQEDLCVHCLACVPICPTNAYEVDFETMKVRYLEEKCIACELCVSVCLFGAIRNPLLV